MASQGALLFNPLRTPFQINKYRCMALVFACVSMCTSAFAAPDEITVFTDDFEKKGEVGYELHINYAARARSVPAYPQEQAPYHVLRLMPEVVWGLSDTWNLGFHAPFSVDPVTHNTTLDGVKLRLQNLHVKDTGSNTNFFYGVNYELSYYHPRITPSRYSAELRGIVGTKQGSWKFTTNPILNRALSNNVNGKQVQLEIYSQAMHTLSDTLALGLEHYASLGNASKPTLGPGSAQISYLVGEFKTANHFDIHLGIGHGWTAGTQDKRVFKALLGLPF
jgi:hypothetical protein